MAGAAATLTGQAQANNQNPPQPSQTTSQNGRFAGKVVLIRGATSGIGEATELAREHKVSSYTALKADGKLPNARSY